MPDFSLQARVTVEGAQAAASNLNDVSNAITGAEKAADEASKNSASTFSGLNDSAQKAADTIDKTLPAALTSAASAADSAAKNMSDSASKAADSANNAANTIKTALPEAFASAAAAAESAAQSMQSVGTAINKSPILGKIKKEVSDFVDSAVPAYEEGQKQLRSWTVQLGSAAAAMEKLREAKELAAVSEFNLASLRRAQQALVNLGVKGAGALKAVALAAQGTNRDVEATAQVMAKALAGSSRGFMQLQYGYGIRAEDLQKFGAILGEEGQVLTDTAEQAEKARQAIEALAEAKWGSAFTESAGSVTQSIHDLQGSIGTLRGNIGSDLAPIFSTLKGTIQQFIDTINRIPGPIRTASVWITALVGGISAVVAGIPAAVTAIMTAKTAFLAFAAAVKASGAMLFSFGGVVGTILAAEAIGNAAIKQWEKNNIAAGEAVKRSADIATAAIKEMRGNVAAELGDIFETEGAEGVKAFMDKNGWSKEDVAAQLQRIEAFKAQLRKEILELQEELAGKDTSSGENAEKQALLDTKSRQYNIYGRAEATLKASGYSDSVKDLNEQNKAAEERQKIEQGITQELNAQRIAAMKAEQAELYRKANRTKAEQERLEALKNEILNAEMENISAKFEPRFSEVEKGTEAYKKLVELQNIYIKNSEKAQAEDLKKIAEERQKIEQGITQELNAQRLAALKAEQAGLDQKTDRTKAEHERLEALKNEILDAERKDISAKFEQRFSEVEKGSEAYKKLVELQNIYIKNAEKAQEEVQIRRQAEAQKAAKIAAEERAKAEKKVTAELQKQTLIQLKAEREKLLEADVKDAEALKEVQERIEQIVKAQTEEDFKERFAEVEKGTKAYKDLMKAKELAITAAISAERQLQEAEKQTNDAEKNALQEQIELIKQKYAERQKELDQNSERSRALKNAEIWEIQAAKDKDRESKKAASAMTWREYREREAGIYEEFRRNTEGLSRTSAAYSSFLKSRDFQLGALSEEYRTGKTALPDALNTMTENVQTGAQSVQSGLSSLSDVLNSGAADVQSGLSSLASALSTASVQSHAKTGA